MKNSNIKRLSYFTLIIVLLIVSHIIPSVFIRSFNAFGEKLQCQCHENERNVSFQFFLTGSMVVSQNKNTILSHRNHIGCLWSVYPPKIQFNLTPNASTSG